MRRYYGETKHFISNSLKKITCCEDHLHEYMLFDWMYMPAPLKIVSFVNCTFDVHYCRVGLSADDEFVKVVALSALPSHHVEDGMHHVQKPGSDREDDDWYEEAPFGFVWDMKVLVAHLDFDLPHNTDRYGSPYEWLNKKMDEKNLIWPYPKRQVRWLMETLEALDGTVLQSVKNTDEDWVRCR